MIGLAWQLLLAGIFLVAVPAGAASVALNLDLVTAGLTRPLAIAHAGDGSGRLFIAQQEGLIRLYKGGSLLPDPFLDVSALVTNPAANAQGLLDVVFHPNYAENGIFFITYTDAEDDSVLARYRVSAGNPNVADPASAEVLLVVHQPFRTHNGDHLAFGPDGFLYYSLGDGGPGDDPDNRGQSLDTLLGKILRLDVDSLPLPGDTYVIPPDNPFVGVPGARGEIWAYGLRNPWRFSFDRTTGDLFVGDVGQRTWEEVNFEPAGSGGGRNYGWRVMEGHHCFEPPKGCDPAELVRPILEYSHDVGCSVTGGYRYRGTAQSALQGLYLYADYCTAKIWAARPGCGGWSAELLAEAGFQLTTFGEDEAGELYVARRGDNPGEGAVFHLTAQPTAEVLRSGFENGALSSWSVCLPAE